MDDTLLINAEIKTSNTEIYADISPSVVNVGGTSWGQITGDINNQQDLIDLISGEIDLIYQDLYNYATKKYVDDEIAKIDTSSYASKEYVDEQISNIDLTNYAQTSYVDEHDTATLNSAKSYTDSEIAKIDLSDYASKDYVDDEISNIDLSNYASETELTQAISNHNESNIAHSDIRNALSGEVQNRENADINLQEQIDAITSSSDVVDIVGTYAQLQSYDTSKLNDNDIVKVLNDSTHDNAESYYRWSKTNLEWSYIGSEGSYYTKAESESQFVPQTRTINNKALSNNITLDHNDVGALSADTSIPTKTSELTNDSNFVSDTNYVHTDNNFTNTLKDKLDNIQSGAEANVQANWNESDNTSDSFIQNKPSIPTNTSDLNNDSGYITNSVNDLTNYTTTSSMNSLLNNKLNKSGTQTYNIAGTTFSDGTNEFTITIT